ncbi:MAG: class I SAM-dependent methyltransferase [Candidatus Latescibacteria bacterium]|nr:class I SAM-dependent methyltransferase [Candidatus Latescibacterota bacterium]
MAKEHVCPVWVGYLLASPVRKWFQNPKKLLGPYIEEGMTALDIGCAMGFFSLPMARMVGPNGKVICVDLQEEMIAALEKRARKAGLSERMETRLCQSNSLGLNDLKEAIDFALASAVVHEVPDAAVFFSELSAAMKPGGRLLVAEPSGRVEEEDFGVTISVAEQHGFKAMDRLQACRSRVALLEKRSGKPE